LHILQNISRVFFSLLLDQPKYQTTQKLLKTVVASLLLGGAVTSPTWAHGGHDDDKFQGAENNTPSAEQITIAPDIQRAIGLKVVSAKEQTLTTGLQVNGQIEAIPGKTAEVNAPVAGRILRLSVQPGQSVKAGQSLTVLDSSEIRTLAVEAERAQALGRTQIAQAQARLQLAKSTYEREKELVRLKISPRKDFEVAEAELRQAETDLSAARTQLKLSGMLLNNRLAQLGQKGVSARRDGSVVLASPIPGMVADQKVTAGEAVEPGKMLFKVVSLGQVWATAQVYEKDLSRVQVGQPVEVVTQSYPGKIFKGRISSLDSTINPETRTLAVRAILDNPGGLLKPAMFATLRLTTGSRAQPVTVIPRSAVLEVDGASVVYVQNGDAFEPTAVTLGQSDGAWIEVKDGVFPGDKVVSERAFQLRAQALKGGTPAEKTTEANQDLGKETDQKAAQQTFSVQALPVWVWGLGGVLLLLGAFFAGMRVAKQSSSPSSSNISNSLTEEPDSVVRSKR
jgi:membrane fusion protein, heavy metal efflux system